MAVLTLTLPIATHSRLCFQAVHSPRRISVVDLETSATSEGNSGDHCDQCLFWLATSFLRFKHSSRKCLFLPNQTNKNGNNKIGKNTLFNQPFLEKNTPIQRNFGLSGNYIWRTKVTAGCEEVFSVRSITRVQHAAKATVCSKNWI